MKQEFLFSKKDEFLDKLRSIIKIGVSKEDITIITPFPVNEVDEILSSVPSKVKFFTLIGAITGLITGFAFTIYTALMWPLLITGGKPIVSIPAFLIIAFELTILFGSLLSLFGFLVSSKLPSVKRIISPIEYGNQFVILID